MNEQGQTRQRNPEPPEHSQYRMFAGMSGLRLCQPPIGVPLQVSRAQIFVDGLFVVTGEHREELLICPEMAIRRMAFPCILNQKQARVGGVNERTATRVNTNEVERDDKGRNGN